MAIKSILQDYTNPIPAPKPFPKLMKRDFPFTIILATTECTGSLYGTVVAGTTKSGHSVGYRYGDYLACDFRDYNESVTLVNE